MLDREIAIAGALASREDLLILTGIGAPAGTVGRLGHRELNFYISGSMGISTSMGLGLAIAQPERPVVVVTGDGELMMNVGALATIGAHKPRNLSILVLDNGEFGETGRQKSHTSMGVDITSIARACAFADADTVREAAQLPAVAERLNTMNGPYLAVLKIAGGKPANQPTFARAIQSGVVSKAEFRKALLGRT